MSVSLKNFLGILNCRFREDGPASHKSMLYVTGFPCLCMPGGRLVHLNTINDVSQKKEEVQ
ncbi:hypothetical protein CSB45_05785 [candidate division KSB3 bacterium]|uniref:Uncharacterized protein n=1 Tax=candidate division KSB3 bacterium TaxID=2044937 RepID=A0A2G6E6M4_9BACT|nr:MAG: hypothetical protein CSB45_05785 [candidate division KSB3 bacterium]PIE30161.1 MAG: hypothetical protein CSA57_04495 [candidate division KSB3 bacterium]